MFKPNGLSLLCLLSLHQVACLLEDSGPLENKVFYVEEGKVGSHYLYTFKFQPPTYSVRLTGETNHLIEITPNDGVLIVKGPLNWEKKRQYRLQLEGLNQSGNRVQEPYSVIINVVDINDNPPQFNQSIYSGEVRQHSLPGKPFMYVAAFDLDDPSTLHSKLSYSILQQFPSVEGTEMYFQIDNVTGAISTTLAVILLPENSTKPHPMKITQVQWNDPHATYELQHKDKSSIELPFTVDQNGTVYVTKPLDREEKDYYSFYIFANDEEGDKLAYPITISVQVVDINDNPPVCDKALSKFEVQENEGVGNLIGIVLASDNDEKGSLNSRLQFTLVDQNPKIPQDNLFRIELRTGSVHLFRMGLNREVATTYKLKVNVTDSVFSTICNVQIHVIDINDKIPIFEKPDYGTVIIAEDQAKGSPIFKIQATDADDPSTGSSQIIYTITKVRLYENAKIGTNVTTVKAFDPEGSPVRYFLRKTDPKWLEIDPVNGHIYTVAQLDYELFPAYIVEIVATDESRPYKSSVAQLILHLEDINDNGPYLVNESVFLCHPLQKDQSAKFEVADPDSVSQNLIYFLTGGEDNWYISKMDGNQGYISPKNLNLEEKVYHVPLQINDGGNPSVVAGVNLKGATIGVLVAVLLVIGVILGLVFLHLKKKKKNEQNVAAVAIRPSELATLN
ncbi:cadherin-17 [Crotalus adamanteus]|uniref:Cadherin-17 n=1 Tax=Crotalus adamanteus TaxID=8729 RepID=A0AAW1BNX9_CROAD